jgi:hypothetical protein
MLFSPSQATCIVSFLDLDRVRHSVEVEAEGLYEAAVLGLVAFRKHDLELNPAGLAQLEVEVRSSIVHTVPVKRIHQWLEGGARSPKEAVTKDRLRALM